jgi:hypothetical protein
MKRVVAIASGLLVILLILLVFFIFFLPQIQRPTPTVQPTSTSSTSTNCNPSTSMYRVVGKHILDSKGNIFIPYGVQLEGIDIAEPSYQTNGALTHLSFSQVQAARDFWHSNTVSMKVSSTVLFDQSPYNKGYLSVIDQTVHWANQLGMNILLTLQYEGNGNSNQPMPTQDALQFWDFFSKHYASNPRVFFDIFNEPRTAALFNDGDTNAVWNFWQHGGTIGGTTYIGFQQLVNIIRGNRVQNLIFADGLAAGEDIHLLPEHTLQGCNIVYAIHPYLNATIHHTPQDWNRWFGNAATVGNFPVVADEWSEYQSNKGECITDAPTVVPQFLSYLRDKGIGVIGYALYPGTLIRGWNFEDPTAYNGPTTICSSSPYGNLNPTVQGAGQLLRQYLAQYSV